MKIKHYLVFKIIFKSGRKQTISAYNIREEDKTKVDDAKDGLIEVLKTVYRDGEPAHLNIGDHYVNLSETSSIKILQRYVFW